MATEKTIPETDIRSLLEKDKKDWDALPPDRKSYYDDLSAGDSNADQRLREHQEMEASERFRKEQEKPNEP